MSGPEESAAPRRPAPARTARCWVNWSVVCVAVLGALVGGGYVHHARRMRDPEVRAERLLRGMVPTRNWCGVPEILEDLGILHDRDSGATRRAFVDMGAAQAVGPLIRFLRERDRGLAPQAARALGWFGAEAAPAVPDLLAALPKGEWWEPEVISHSLACIGPVAIPALVEALHDDNDDVREGAADALAGDVTSQLTVGGCLGSVSVKSLKDKATGALVGGNAIGARFDVVDLFKGLRLSGDFTDSDVDAGTLCKVAVKGLMSQTGGGHEICAHAGSFDIADATWKGTIDALNDHWFGGLQAWVG